MKIPWVLYCRSGLLPTLVPRSWGTTSVSSAQACNGGARSSLLKMARQEGTVVALGTAIL